mmetsp:Transcript_35938/g.83988  ORF Transcript_35938/g.83988 Transcript_35938/m.83988 type:complete len:320 (-) Transcript_35938:1583-2542(-)
MLFSWAAAKFSLSGAVPTSSSGSPRSLARKRAGSEGTSSALRFSLCGTTWKVVPSSHSTFTEELGTYALSLTKQVTRAEPSDSTVTSLPSSVPVLMIRVPSGRRHTFDWPPGSTKISIPSSWEIDLTPVCGSRCASIGTGSNSYSMFAPSSTSTASRMSFKVGSGSGGSGSLSRSSSSSASGTGSLDSVGTSLLPGLLGGLLEGLLPGLPLSLLPTTPASLLGRVPRGSGSIADSDFDPFNEPMKDPSSSGIFTVRPKRLPSLVVTRQWPGIPKYLLCSDGSISSSSSWLASQAAQILATRRAQACAATSQPRVLARAL